MSDDQIDNIAELLSTTENMTEREQQDFYQDCVDNVVNSTPDETWSVDTNLFPRVLLQPLDEIASLGELGEPIPELITLDQPTNPF